MSIQPRREEYLVWLNPGLVNPNGTLGLAVVVAPDPESSELPCPEARTAGSDGTESGEAGATVVVSSGESVE